MKEIAVHPIQTQGIERGGEAPQSVTMRAYEVYSAVYGPQGELVTGSCRGGFGVGELIAFLYARSFPKEQWRDRIDEALTGLVLNGRRK